MRRKDLRRACRPDDERELHEGRYRIETSESKLTIVLFLLCIFRQRAMDHDHATRVALEEIVNQRDNGHDSSGRGGESQAGQALDEGSDKGGGNVTVASHVVR